MRHYQKETARYHLKRDRQEATALEKSVDEEIKAAIGEVSFAKSAVDNNYPRLFDL